MRRIAAREPFDVELRVAHIISGLGVGGAERHLANLLNAMSCEYKAVICVGRRSSGPTFHEVLAPDVHQFQIRMRRWRAPIDLLRIVRVLKRNRVNVVHTHMYFSNLYGTLAAWLANVPVVVTSEHGENPWKGPVQRWLEQNVISRIASVRFCVSPRILELRRDKDGIPSSKLRLVPNGTPMPPQSVKVPHMPRLVIGAVGRFIPAKDFPGLLEAVAKLRDRGRDFHLYIVGDGPERDAIRDRIEQLGLSALVSLPGMVSDMDAWYSKFDIYVSSSIREGLPIALLEAMAHGLPVVATDVGASSHTVGHDEAGLIVAPSEPGLLAAALEKVMDNTELRIRYGRTARKRIEEHYSVASVAALHEDCYRRFLAGEQSAAI